MYKWDYDAPSWSEEELREIAEIKRNTLRIFEDEHEGYSTINVTVVKNIHDCPENVYDGHSLSKLNAEYAKLIDYLNSNAECASYIKTIEDKCKLFETAVDIEKKLDEMDFNRIYDTIAESVNFFPENSEAAVSLRKFLDFLKGTSVSCHAFGNYDCESNKIVIYMSPIKKFSGIVNESILVEEVLVRELFQAMLYNSSDSGIRKSWVKNSRYNKIKTAVKESLADYFAWFYMAAKMNQSECAIQIYWNPQDEKYYMLAMAALIKKWDMHIFPNYPCTGAKAFMSDGKLPRSSKNIAGRYGGLIFLTCKYRAMHQWKKSYDLICASLLCGYSEAYIKYARLEMPTVYFAYKHFGYWDVVTQSLGREFLIYHLTLMGIMFSMNEIASDAFDPDRFPDLSQGEIERLDSLLDILSQDSNLSEESRVDIIRCIYDSQSYIEIENKIRHILRN